MDPSSYPLVPSGGVCEHSCVDCCSNLYTTTQHMSEATIIDFVPSPPSEIITLNAGGELFHTLKSTLLRAGGLFKHMIEHADQWPHDANGHIFLDRDPNRFCILLNWLRNWDRQFTHRIAPGMYDELMHFRIHSRLLRTHKVGMPILVEDDGAGVIESMKLFTVTVNGKEYPQSAFDGHKLRRVS